MNRLSNSIDSSEAALAHVLEDSSGLVGAPSGVGYPEDLPQLQELIRECRGRHVKITPIGLQSSTTGSAVALEGIVAGMRRMSRILDVDIDRRLAIVEPGVVLDDLKQFVAEAGLYYPPDPTSEKECTIGGTIATNASGPRSLKYGPTSSYVAAVEVVLADAQTTRFERISLEKNAAGYRGFLNPVDLIVGSEGTLGIISKAELRLLRPPERVFGLLVFFDRLLPALEFVIDCRTEKSCEPRCLELLDSTALRLIRGNGPSLSVPPQAGAAIYLEQECREADLDQWLDAYSAIIERRTSLAAETLFARTSKEFEEIRVLRHLIPSSLIERGRDVRADGGRRVSTDFAVPLEQLLTLFERAIPILQDAKVDLWTCYGHIGNAHPHMNLLAADGTELTRALSAADRLVRLALELGGTVSAEHGIGKLKRAALAWQYPAPVLRAMRAMKQALDPDGLFSPGNIFET